MIKVTFNKLKRIQCHGLEQECMFCFPINIYDVGNAFLLKMDKYRDATSVFKNEIKSIEHVKPTDL